MFAKFVALKKMKQSPAYPRGQMPSTYLNYIGKRQMDCIKSGVFSASWVLEARQSYIEGYRERWKSLSHPVLGRDLVLS